MKIFRKISLLYVFMLIHAQCYSYTLNNEEKQFFDKIDLQWKMQMIEEKKVLTPFEIFQRRINFENFMDFLKKKFVPRYSLDFSRNYILSQKDWIKGVQAFDSNSADLLCFDFEANNVELLENHFKNKSMIELLLIENKSVAQSFLEIKDRIDALSSSVTRRQLHFEVFKTLSFYNEISHFRNSSYITKQISVIDNMCSVAMLCEKYGKESFPCYPIKDTTCFFFSDKIMENMKGNSLWGFDEVTPPFPFAVLKNNGEWRLEQAAWEISCLFGFDKAFLPTGVIDSEELNCKASVQPFIQAFPLRWVDDFLDPVTGTLEQHSASISLFDQNDFGECFLGSIVLSLYDQSITNCRYIQDSSGRMKILNFDNGCMMPSVNGIFPIFSSDEKSKNTLHAISRSLWTWYFDFPQARKILIESEKLYLQGLIADWKLIVYSFMDYIDHPCCTYNVDSFEYVLEALRQRVQVICNLIEGEEELRLIDIVYQIIPEYKPIINQISSSISLAENAPFSTLLGVNEPIANLEFIWKVHFGVPQYEINHFLSWYRDFAWKIHEKDPFKSQTLEAQYFIEKSLKKNSGGVKGYRYYIPPHFH